jgi:hypothetical protein
VRDSQIIKAIQNFDLTRDLVMKQFRFLESRQRAVDAVLSETDKDWKSKVDAKHQQLMDIDNANLIAAVAAAKEEMRKPKLLKVNA